MIIKEKRWLSRFVAMLCVLTMVVGVLTPASVGVAKASNVSEIIIVVPDEIINETDNIRKSDFILDETEYTMIEEPDNTDDGYWNLDSYKCKYNEELKQISIKPLDSDKFNVRDRITIYSNEEFVPEVIVAEDSDIETNLTFVSNTSGTSKWIATLKIDGYMNGVAKYNIFPGEQKYNVNFSVDEDCDVKINNPIDSDSETITVNSGTTVQFTASLLSEDSSKEVSVTSNERTLEKTAADTYKLTVSKDTTVNVAAVSKTYEVDDSLAKSKSGEGYLYMKDTLSTTIIHGNDYSFYVYPQDGHNTPVVTVKSKIDNDNYDTGITLTGYNNHYVISNIQADKKIEINDGGNKQYNVSFGDGIGYSFSEISIGEKTYKTAGTYPIKHGEDVKFKVSESKGYKITRVNAGTSTILTADGEGYYKLENVTADTVINVAVQKISYTITYPSSELGKYSVVPDVTSAGIGDFITFNVIPEQGNKAPKLTAKYSETSIEDAEKGDQSVSVMSLGGTQYKVEIKGHTIITATDSGKETCTIDYNSGEGYKFYALEGTEMLKPTVDYGESVEFKLHVDKHYSDSTPIVSANGKTVSVTSDDNDLEDGKDYKCIITNVTENQTITVTVKKNIYTVTLQDGNGYTLSTNQDYNVEANNKFTFRWNIIDGYNNPDNIFIGGQEQAQKDLGSTGTYSFEVTDDTIVSLGGVTPKTYKITVDGENDDNAEVKQVGTPGFDEKSIPYGDSYSFKVTPNDYYKIVTVKVNDIPITSISGVYTIENIKADKKIAVETEPVKLTVHYVDNQYNTEIQDDVFDITNTDKVYENGKIKEGKLKFIDCTKKLYKFEGWDKEEVSLATDNKDSEITLTAKWTLKNRIASDKYVNLTTTGESSSKGFNDGQTSYTYKLSFHSLFKLAEDLEEDLDNIAITGYGTFYSDKDITVDEDCFNSITDRKKEQSPTLYKAAVGDTSEHINNYYANVTGLYASDLNDTNNFFYLNIGANTSGITRHAVGWIELSIGKETIVIYSEDIPVTTAAERQ